MLENNLILVFYYRIQTQFYQNIHIWLNRLLLNAWPSVYVKRFKVACPKSCLLFKFCHHVISLLLQHLGLKLVKKIQCQSQKSSVHPSSPNTG